MSSMFANQKAQEIGYALIRIAARVRRQEMRQRIERFAFELLEETAKENLNKALLVSLAIEQLVNLGRSVYEIEPINARILINELSILNSAMRQSLDLGELPDLHEFFSQPPAIIENGNSTNEKRQESGNPAIGSHESGNGMGAAIRQSAIIDKIRQTANRQAQLRELLAAFPDISERTMRYDLQKLCNQGLIERVGNGGPGVYYTPKS